MKIEVPLSITWRIRGVRLVERTASSFKMELETSKLLLFWGWIEFTFKVLLIAVRSLWEPLRSGGIYKITGNFDPNSSETKP